jgi:hypothetical protein
MKKFKQLRDENDLEGKIITKAIASGREFIIHFINDEFCVLKVDGYEESYIDVEDGNQPPTPTRYNIDQLKHLGFIDDQEFKELRDRFIQEKQKQQEARDRAQFESLKKKYGN